MYFLDYLVHLKKLKGKVETEKLKTTLYNIYLSVLSMKMIYKEKSI